MASSQLHEALGNREGLLKSTSLNEQGLNITGKLEHVKSTSINKIVRVAKYNLP